MGLFDFFKRKYKNKKTYDENEQLEQEGDFKNGELDGIIKSYHENGQLKSEENFKNGLEDGIHKLYQ